jgi:protease I
VRRMLLQSKRVACFVGDDYEDLEIWYPLLRLQEEGARVDLISQEAGGSQYRGKHGYPARSDHAIGEVKAADYDAVIVAGGWMPDKLRRDAAVLRFCREMDAAGKVVATICHGPWILISAGVVKGKRMTSTPGIKDDVMNAGATWVDAEAVRDGNLVSARRPPDLPAFCRLLVQAMAEK